jgi:hypothetical protein
MTSGRFALPSASFLIAVLTITTPGCGNGASPCTDCPAIEGRYQLDFPDGGTPSECTQLGVDLPDGEVLNISRTEDRLSGTLEGVSLQGTISGESTFSLSGARAGTPDGGVSGTLSLNGTYTSPGGDGGTARLTGTFAGSFSRAGATDAPRCNLTRPFSGARQ